jgi:hypothetical protein
MTSLILQIRHCIEWASSSVFPASLSWSRINPISIFRPVHRCPTWDTPRTEALNIMVKYGRDQYHLLRLDLSKNPYKGDIPKYILKEYTRYRGNFKKTLSPWKVSSLEYVKVGDTLFRLLFS